MLKLNNFEIFSSFRFFFFKKLLNYLGIALYNYISIISLQLFIVQNKIRLYLYILQNSCVHSSGFFRKIKGKKTKAYINKKRFTSKYSSIQLATKPKLLQTQSLLKNSVELPTQILEKKVFKRFIEGTLPLWKVHFLLSSLKNFKLNLNNLVCSKLLKNVSIVSNTPLIAKVLQTFNFYLISQHSKAAKNLVFYWEYHHNFLTRVLSLGIFASFKFELFLQKLFNLKLQILYRYEFKWLLKNCWLRKKLAFTYLHSFLLTLLLLDLSIFVGFIVTKLQKTKKIKRYQKALLNTFKRFFIGVIHYEVLDFIGFRFLLRGKLNGKRRKGKYTFKLGFLPNYNLNYRYLYNYQQAVSRFGVFGVKSLLILK